MSAVRFVGFFSELQVLPWDDHPLSITGGAGQNSYARSAMAAYLSSGPVVFDVLEHGRDVIGGTDPIESCSSLRTDGDWIWRNDLSFYVDRYRIGLPGEFVESVESRNYAQVDVPADRMGEVLAQVRRVYQPRPTVKRFNRAFIGAAVSAVIADSRPVEDVAGELGIKPSMLANWVAAARKNPHFLAGLPE